MKKFIFAGAIALMMAVASCGTKNTETETTTNGDTTVVETDSVAGVDTVDGDSVLVDSVAE